MDMKDLNFQKASDVQNDLLMVEAVNFKHEILFGLVYHEKTGKSELVFTEAGAFIDFDLKEFRIILDKLEQILQDWLLIIGP